MQLFGIKVRGLLFCDSCNFYAGGLLRDSVVIEGFNIIIVILDLSYYHIRVGEKRRKSEGLPPRERRLK